MGIIDELKTFPKVIENIILEYHKDYYEIELYNNLRLKILEYCNGKTGHINLTTLRTGLEKFGKYFELLDCFNKVEEYFDVWYSFLVDVQKDGTVILTEYNIDQINDCQNICVEIDSIGRRSITEFDTFFEIDDGYLGSYEDESYNSRVG